MRKADLHLPYIFDLDYGNTIYLSGDRGTGKTHQAVNLIYYFVNYLDWAVITNIQFKNEGELTEPDSVYFATDMVQLWKSVADIRESDPYKPIIVVIDEFHKTVDRYRTLDDTVLAINKWLSENRKYIMCTLFITQFVEMIPRRLLKWTDFFMIKSNNLTQTYNNRYNTKYGKKYLSYLIPVKARKIKISEGHEQKKHQVEEFDESEVKWGDFTELYKSGKTEWTKDQGEYKFRTYGSASFELGNLKGDGPDEWLPDLVKEISVVSEKKIAKTISNFFDNYKSKNEEDNWSKNQIKKLKDRTDLTFEKIEEITGIPISTIKYRYYN